MPNIRYNKKVSYGPAVHDRLLAVGIKEIIVDTNEQNAGGKITIELSKAKSISITTDSGIIDITLTQDSKENPKKIQFAVKTKMDSGAIVSPELACKQ